MTTVATRIRQISDLEGFDLIVKMNGQLVDATKNGVLGKWPNTKKSKSAWRVTKFREKFSKIYPGYTCDVLLEDGEVAHGNCFLSNVRESYEIQDDDE